MRLFLVAFIFFVLLPGSTALASGKSCPLDSKQISNALRQEAKKIEGLSGPVARYGERGQDPGSAPLIEEKTVRAMLTASWRAFSFRGKNLQKRVDLNMQQIEADSSRKPHLSGLFLGQATIPEIGHPGGLFAFFDSGYREWRDYGSWRGEASKFNPLSNIFAAVAVQVQSKQIFSGKTRISVPKNNPCN